MMRFVLFSLANLLFSLMIAQTAVQKAINNLAADPALQHGSLGVCVIDVESGKVIAQVNKDQSLIPASSLKVVTTATALSKLGADFRFKTELQYDGEIDEKGTLRGNLYIKGYGDPTLGSDHFEKALPLDEVMQEFVDAIKKAGIKKIEGKIVGDASFFNSSVNGRSWLWEDLGNYYAAGAWGLNLHENRYYLHFKQNQKLGATPRIEAVEPEIPNLLHINEVRSAGRNSGDNAYVFGVPYAYTRFVRGTIPVGSNRFTIKGAIPDPPFFAAYYLMNKLENEGVETSKIATSSLEEQRMGVLKDKPRTSIHLHQSPALEEIVMETNLESVNLYCEAMLRYLGVSSAENFETEGGLKIIHDFWNAKGLDTNGFFMEDGSGLSPFNTVTAFQLAKVMQLIAKDQSLYTAFKESLPAAGRSGTMKYMLKGTKAEGNVFAKSGGIKRVRSYTGYAVTSSGRLLAFSMMANHFTGKSSEIRKRMEKIMLALCQ